MIWFRCKQCGKTHGREEALAGILVFCDCGEGNRVPPESTAPGPAVPPPPEPPLAPRRPGEDSPVPRRRWRRGAAPLTSDPERCRNHPEQPRAAVCDACGEPFCAACVVSLQGKTLCGPCKDFRSRAARRPPRVSALAVASLLVALVVASPVACCLPFSAVAAQANGAGNPAVTAVLGLIAVGLPLTALVLGLCALREIETTPNVSGRPVALTGAIAAGVGLLWCVAVYSAVVFKHGAP